ncbi:MAG TPA: glutamate-cysteine ligase family protein [Candidatus Nanoarchaeia archaeon]|nr:glutamate-cysteine ligase family protein [Candidatus Nanoarchaeia archaeon]
MYKPLEVLGPEHELSIVDQELKALPISDKVIKGYCGKTQNFIELPKFTFGKEMQLHVMEIKGNKPFKSPVEFEESMQSAVTTLSDFLHEKFGASLLGTGMHPLLKLNETRIWPHNHQQIYEAYGKVFDLKQHGWLNIQSFHLNLAYAKGADAVLQHNLLANICPYLPAIAASSPIYEGTLHAKMDNRLAFYKSNQREVRSVTGDVVPEYTSSLDSYRKEVIEKYSQDLANKGASQIIINKEWVNSRGVIFRFDRKALEVRVIDEQECIKSDVAISCFIRASLRGLMSSEPEFLPHEVLVKDFNSIIAEGLNARVQNPNGPTAREVCKHLFSIAWANADKEEKNYLPIIEKRIEEGSLSEVLRRDVLKESQYVSVREAIVMVYSRLIRNLEANQPYF